jgi:hypothetical protein
MVATVAETAAAEDVGEETPEACVFSWDEGSWRQGTEDICASE